MIKTLSLALLFGFQAQASLGKTQYIQCYDTTPDSTYMMVVSLTDDAKNTLFLTAGVESGQDSGVINITISESIEGKVRFVGNAPQATFDLRLPLEIISKKADSFLASLIAVDEMDHQMSIEFSCFSRIYDRD